METKLGIYSRVSTEEQSQKGLSLEDQVKRGIECSKRFLFTSYEVFQDGGYSGTIPFQKRPGLNSLINMILKEEIQGIYVTDIDRLSRDNLQTLLIKSILMENGVRLFDVNGEIVLSDENQELLTDLRSLLSSFEIKKTSKRIKRVLERNAIDGKVGGGPLLNFGYTKDIDKKLIVDEDESKIVRWIFQMSIEGKGTKIIANILNEKNVPTKRSSSKKGYLKVRGKKKENFLWRDSVIYKILTNPIYKGKRLFKGKSYDCPNIIEPGLFDTVQNLLKERKNLKNTTNKYFYLLKGKIICGCCNSRFYGRKREDLSDNQYICSSQRYSNSFCGTRGINIDFLDTLVWNHLLNLDVELNKFYNWYEKTDQVTSNMMSLKSSRVKEKQLEKEIRNLIELGTKSSSIKIEYFNEKMTELNTEIDRIRKEKMEDIKRLNSLTDKDEIINLVKQHITVMKKPNLSFEDKRNIIISFVDVINILWNKETLKHSIIIEYKIDRLTQFQLGNDIELDYKKYGWRLEKQKFFKTNILVRRLVSDDLGKTSLTDIPHLRIN